MFCSKVMLAAILAVGSAQALAASSAQLSLGNLRYELVDLDLNDGITPTFNYARVVAVPSANASVWTDTAHDSENTHTSGNPASVNFSVSVPDASSAVVVKGGDSLINATVAASVSVGDAATVDPGFNAYAYAHTGLYEISLSEKSKLIITLDAHVEANTNAATWLDFAEATVSAGGWMQGFELGAPYMSAYDGISLRLGHMGLNGTASDASKTFVLAYENTGSTTAIGSFYLTATATAMSAVPEPSSWAMLVAGLGLAGFAARRRSA